MVFSCKQIDVGKLQFTQKTHWPLTRRARRVSGVLLSEKY